MSAGVLFTVFFAVRNFAAPFDRMQRYALEGWRALGMRPHVFLTTPNARSVDAVRDYAHPHVPRRLNGVPMVDSIFEEITALDLPDHVYVYTCADMIFFDDFIDAVARVMHLRRFCLIGRSTDMRDVEIDGNGLAGVRRRAEREGALHQAAGIAYFAFRPRDLFENIPPFCVGHRRIDNWMVSRALDAGVPVIDATHDVLVVNQLHNTPSDRDGELVARNIRLMRESGLPVSKTTDATHELIDGELRKKEK